MGTHDATAGAIDGLAIAAHPVTNSLEALDSLYGQLAVGAGTDVDDIVGIVAGSLDDVLDDIFRALVLLVGDVVAPDLVHGHHSLQRQLSYHRSLGITGSVLTGQVLLKGLQVFAGLGGLVVVVGHETAGLQAVDKAVLLVETPVKLGVVLLVPVAVKPDGTDGAIVGEQLGELMLHESEVGVIVVLVLGLADTHTAPSLRIVGARPVYVRIVEVELDAILLTGISELFEHIAVEGSTIDDVIVIGRCLEHREAIVMTGGKGDVAGTGGLERLDPFLGVELGGIETVGQVGIFLIINVAVTHHPLAVAEHGVESPVDVDAKLVVLEFGTGLEDFGRSLILSRGGKACHHQQE